MTTESPIVIVHLFAYGLKSYFGRCLTGTALHNPESSIYVISAEEEVKVYVESLCLPNVNCFVFSREYEAAKQYIEPIFYHDGLNTKNFDLQCFVRHVLVARCISESKLPNVCAMRRFVFSDSDIMIIDRVDKIFNLNKSEDDSTAGVTARTPLTCYFSAWKAYEYIMIWLNRGALCKYFDAARKQQRRCSDMHYFQWSVRIGLVSHSSGIHDKLVHIDTFRDYLYYSQMWKSVLGDEALTGKLFGCISSIEEVKQYPRGPWKDKDFIRLFCDRKFLADIFKRGKPLMEYSEVYKEAFIPRAIYLSSTAFFRNQLSKAEFSSKSKTLSINTITKSAGLRVAMIHFQGNAKELANRVFEFLFLEDV